ncbi:MAG: hypothetical protein ACR2NR_18290 [Solirubrobacteraceae bacterium]
MEYDDRGFCVAVVADELINQGSAGFDVLRVLDRAGWGVITLPPAWYGPELAAPLLEQAAEHIQEFDRHGYAVVLIGERAGLGDALATVGIAVPERIEARDAEQLATVLGERAGVVKPRDAAAEQRGGTPSD